MRLLKLVLLFYLPSFLVGQQLSFALEQLEAQAIIDNGLSGKGVKIGIIDGGFLGANKSPILKHHFQDNRIAYYKDFVTPDLVPYGGSKGLDDTHGTEVWQMIGGINPDKNIQYGLATEATYFLARTDHAAYEKRIEEKFLIQALSEMINQGVQIVNISLGYTNGYARKAENYTPSQMDGKTTWVTRAIDSILSKHDILVIISAGNDGDGRWQTLSAPADSKNVLTVGASKFGRAEEMKYSAKGHEVLEYVKPDIMCYSTKGTSFSAPVIVGLAACLLEYDPSLTAKQIKNLLIQSASSYPYPNNFYGNGIPSGKRILQLLKDEEVESAQTISSAKSYVKIPAGKVSNDRGPKAIIYHKNGWRVMKKETIRAYRMEFKIKRFNDCQQSSILLDNRVTEVIWKNK